MRYARLSFASLSLLVMSVAQGVDLTGSVQTHGFFSHALALTDRNQVGSAPSRTLGNMLTEAGINTTWQANTDWLLSGQLLWRRDGVDPRNLRVDSAFVDHTLLNHNGHQLAVQVGIIKNPYGFYNMTRDVAHTRPSVLLPQSLYHDQGRDFFLSAPGFALHGREEEGQNTFSWQVNVLKPDVNSPNMVAFMVGPQSGQLQGKTSVLGQMIWEREGGRWRSGISLGSLSMHYQPAPTDFFGAGRFTGAGDMTLNTGVLSLEHNLEKWSFTTEYSRTRQLRNNFNVPGASFMDNDSTLEEYYLQAQWRFIPKWQALLRYDAIYVDIADRNGMLFAAASGAPASQRYARDWMFGLRYDPNLDWSLFAELHHVNGTAWLSKLTNPAASTQPQWNMLTLQAAYHF